MVKNSLDSEWLHPAVTRDRNQRDPRKGLPRTRGNTSRRIHRNQPVHRTTGKWQVEPRRREAPDDAAAARLTRTVYEPGQIERSATRSGARTRPRTVRGRREALCETWGALGVVSEARDPDETGVSERTRTPAFS